MLKDIFCPICKTPVDFYFKIISAYNNSCECELLIGNDLLISKKQYVDLNYFFYNKEIETNVIIIFYNHTSNNSEISYKENLYNDDNNILYKINFNPINKSFDELIKITSDTYKLQLLN